MLLPEEGGSIGMDRAFALSRAGQEEGGRFGYWEDSLGGRKKTRPDPVPGRKKRIASRIGDYLRWQSEGESSPPGKVGTPSSEKG